LYHIPVDRCGVVAWMMYSMCDDGWIKHGYSINQIMIVMMKSTPVACLGSLL